MCEKVQLNTGFAMLQDVSTTSVLAAGQLGLLKHSFSISTWEFCENPSDNLRAERKLFVGGKELMQNCIKEKVGELP